MPWLDPSSVSGLFGFLLASGDVDANPVPRGLPSIKNRNIYFSRSLDPMLAGIPTFLKSPYVENVRDIGHYDVAIVGEWRPTASRGVLAKLG